ncbi:roadblock/LC7 domain-containing protein [Streptomyces seoulensis]|uniref:roadblock/LC7 domain-containing protein n=1 Tax=Streptomyces seoulensis TaxID=73044 RepID=UPI001FCB4B75|nr:roadblock/LC7 domain-containing protein [Streptomyces seoulensis]BDH07143.1 hypothetical protein HEK131_43700 [Streptomyces seoulensis]
MNSGGAIPNTQQVLDPTSGPKDRMKFLLTKFVAENPAVTHAVLVSRDGLKLLDSDVDPDWADALAATISGMASLGAAFTGPSNRRVDPNQILVERGDCFLFLQHAGASNVFPTTPGRRDAQTGTILGVIAAPNADLAAIGYQMASLIERFRPYLTVDARATADDTKR